MRRTFALAALASLLATAAFADYVVVLKDGRRMVAREKWKIVDGKALVELTNGTTLQLDPALIDESRSEAATRSGLGDAKVLQTVPQGQPKQEAPSLGSLATIRRPAAQTPQPEPRRPAELPRPSTATAVLDPSVAAKFNAAFENVGLFERTLSMSAPDRLRIELTADNEDQVFKAISATSFIFANVPTDFSTVELFLKMTNGGSSGRFQMSREEAAALANKQVEWYDYYLRKVIF